VVVVVLWEILKEALPVFIHIDIINQQTISLLKAKGKKGSIYIILSVK
jgi:hypothetical protein